MERGRKGNVPSEIIVDTIVKYKNDIVIDGKVLSKSAQLWQQISEELSKDGQIKASSLYTFVTCDRYNLRKLLDIPSAQNSRNIYKNENIESTDISLHNYVNEHNNSVNEDNSIFTISLTQREYQSLLDTKVYKNRVCVRFKSGEWEDVIAEKIWNKTRIQCGINFKSHYLTKNADYGNIVGKYILLLFAIRFTSLAVVIV